MMMRGGEIMRKVVRIQTVSQSNEVTNVWIQHLINRIIIGQLNLPHRLQAELLNETLTENIMYFSDELVQLDKISDVNTSG